MSSLSRRIFLFCRSVSFMFRCRFKLASTNFYFQLKSVRSLLQRPKDPKLLNILRQLLWVDSVDAASYDDLSVRHLVAFGQTYLGPDGR